MFFSKNVQVLTFLVTFCVKTKSYKVMRKESTFGLPRPSLRSFLAMICVYFQIILLNFHLIFFIVFSHSKDLFNQLIGNCHLYDPLRFSFLFEPVIHFFTCFVATFCTPAA